MDLFKFWDKYGKELKEFSAGQFCQNCLCSLLKLSLPEATSFRYIESIRNLGLGFRINPNCVHLEKQNINLGGGHISSTLLSL